jgi:hypothetical protein
MALEIKIERLKELIFSQTEIMEQQRLICAIQNEYQEETARAKENAEKHAAFEKEYADLNDAHLKLQAAQSKKPPDFVLHNGVLWKPQGAGFENFPYCNECAHHPVMVGMPPRRAPMFWQCSAGHIATACGPPA